MKGGNVACNLKLITNDAFFNLVKYSSLHLCKCILKFLCYCLTNVSISLQTILTFF